MTQHAVHTLWLQQGDTNPPKPVEWGMVLTTDDEIAALNKRWRGKDGPTDVLSFALMEDDATDTAELQRIVAEDFGGEGMGWDEDENSEEDENDSEDGDDVEEDGNDVEGKGDSLDETQGDSKDGMDSNALMMDGVST